MSNARAKLALAAQNAAPLQRTVTVSAAGNAISNAARRNRIIAAARAVDMNTTETATVARGITILRSQTGLRPDDFASVVTAVMDADASDPHADDAMTAVTPLNLEERVLVAQGASHKYVKKYGVPCNLVVGATYMPAISYIGALGQLDRLGLFAQIRNYAGVAGGAIICALLSVGISIARMTEIATTTKFNKFVSLHRLSGLKFARTHGLVGGKKFVKWFKRILRGAIVDENITLAGVHAKCGGRLVIVATNLSTTTPTYFDYRSDPELRLWEAVLMAISYCPAMRPRKYGDNYYVDASALVGLPLNAFHYNSHEHPINQRTVALLAICDGVSTKTGGSIGAQIGAIADCVLASAQKHSLDEQDRARTIVIDCGKMSAFDFGLDESARGNLMDIGATAVIDHFAAAGIHVPIIDKYSVDVNGFEPTDEPEQTAAYGVAVVSTLEKGKSRVNL